MFKSIFVGCPFLPIRSRKSSNVYIVWNFQDQKKQSNKIGVIKLLLVFCMASFFACVKILGLRFFVIDSLDENEDLCS